MLQAQRRDRTQNLLWEGTRPAKVTLGHRHALGCQDPFSWLQDILWGQKGTSSLPQVEAWSQESCSFVALPVRLQKIPSCQIRVIAAENNAGEAERALRKGRGSERASEAAGAGPTQTGSSHPTTPSAAITALIRAL